MFAKIIEWSIENKFLVLLTTALLAGAGIYSVRNTPLDAIPDLSDVQVILYTEYPGQGPRIVEDQVTYPLTTQMLAVPHAKVVRGYSFFGFSFVYIIFEDGTDMYWARSRVLEYLNYVSGRLPRGVTPTLGPDATGVGWAFMYALKSDRHDLGQLRSIQDFYLKYELTGVQGVAEVHPRTVLRVGNPDQSASLQPRQRVIAGEVGEDLDPQWFSQHDETEGIGVIVVQLGQALAHQFDQAGSGRDGTIPAPDPVHLAQGTRAEAGQDELACEQDVA